MPDPTKLSEKNRAKLDGIVKQMTDNNESDDNIKFVVEDFKSKYAEKKNPIGTSSSPGKNSELEPTTGSSAGKNSNGFPKIDSNSVAPNFEEMKPAVENSAGKEKRLREKLANVKVTPENMDTVMAETDALSATIKSNQQAKEQARSKRVKELETSFYDATRNNDDDAVAEQRLQDAVQVNGVWNNVKNIAKKSYNTAIDALSSTSPTLIGLQSAKVNTDPLGEEKLQVKQQAIKNKETLSDSEITQRAHEIFKEKEKDNLFLDRANSFLDDLDSKDKEILRQDRALKADHLEEENLKRLKVVSAMRSVADGKISEYKNIENQLSKLKESGQPFPEDLYDQYTSLGSEIKNIGAQLQKNEDYILNNKKDLGTAQQELDLFNREYGDFKNFIGNIGASAAELGTGLLGAGNYIASFSPNIADQVRAMKGQEVVSGLNKDIEENRKNLRTPVGSVESPEGFLNYASDLVANQLPILATTATGSGGLSVIGASSAGKKYTDMNNEVRDGKAAYSPFQMATAPLLYGGAEMAGEYATMGILRKGGRVIESIVRGEADLIKKTAIQKAKEWSKDFGIDMSKEMAGEQFTNFAQNFNEKYVLGKKDVGLLDNTGQVFKDTFTLTSILKAAPHMFGAVVKPFQSKTDLGTLDENSRKIIEFSKQLNSEDLTETERSVIQKQIEKATAESSKIVSNTIGKIDDMPSELYDEVVNLNTKAGEIKSQAREINDGSLPNKNQLLEGLEEDYKALQEKRNGIIDGNTTVVDVLPLKDQEKLKKQALEDLVNELNPDGKKNIKITNEQVVERANEIYNDSKKNEEIKPSETEEVKPVIDKKEVVIPPVPEDYNIVDEKKTYTELNSLVDDYQDTNGDNHFSVTTNNGKSNLAAVSVKEENGKFNVIDSEIFNRKNIGKNIGYLTYRAMINEANKRGIEVFSDGKYLSKEAQKVWERLVKDGFAEKVGDIKGDPEYSERESFPQFKTIKVKPKTKGNSPLTPSETQQNGLEAEVNLPQKMNFTEEEKAKVQKKVVEKPRVILRSGKVGTDAFFALPNEGVFGEVVDKIGNDENVTAYRYPKDFKIKDLSNDVVFDEYMSKKMFEDTRKEGYDAAYVMEIDGSKVLHVINPQKLTLLDEKLPELRNNETISTTNTAADGNVRSVTAVVEQNGTAEPKNTTTESVSKTADSRKSEGNIEVKQYKASDNGKTYNVIFENGELKITDENGKAPSAPTRRIIEAKHAENFDFTKGETALDKQKINDVSTWEEDVAAHSENPVEVAENLLRAYAMDASEGLDTQSKHIAEAIGGKGVDRKSFVQRMGKKGMKDIPGALALQYFAQKGKGAGLDIIAQNAEIAMYGDWDSQNPRITEDDVIDFINDNPRGTADFLNSAKKDKINALKTAFTHLTGLPANDKFLQKAIEQQRAKDKFINEYMTENDVLSDEDFVNLQSELDQFNNSQNEEKNSTESSGKIEPTISGSQEGKNGSGIQGESRQDDSGSQEQKSGEVTEKTSAEQLLDWLDEMENNLDQFGKENLSSGIPIVVAKAAIQAMRVAVKAGMAVADVIQAGIDALKQSDWYINLSPSEKSQAEKDFNDSFGNPQIDNPSARQTENLLNRSVSDKISEDDAYDEVKSTFEKARTELSNKKSFKEYSTEAYRNFVKRFTDRQYLSKSLLNKSGMKAVKNLIINAHGASGRAKIQFEEAYNEIYKKLSTEDRKTLDEIIQAKRFIAIDENREARGLEPVSHPNFIDKNKSEKFLSKLEKELGTEKYNDLVKRSEAYFKTYKGLLKDMLNNGLISKESYDSMSDVDYQPRVFLQFVTDFNGDLETNKRANNIDSGGLSSDQIKSMSEGDANSLVLNSEWLLSNSLLSRSKAMAMNNINKRFMNGEFQESQKRFDKLDPKNLKGDDARFYKYFKELSSKIIDNPIIGKKESGKPKFKYDKTPANFGKAYYYIDGQRHEFFIEDELHESWNDNVGGFLSSNAKEFISYASGAALVKAIATGNNPAFPIVNTPRDFMFTTTFSDQYSKIVPKAMMQVANDVVKSIKEIRKSDSDVLKKYIEHGGAMDFLSSQGTLKKESLLGQAVDKAVSANARDTAKSIFSKVTLHKISQYSEMMFRLGIFQRSIKNQLDSLGLNDISEVTNKQQLDDIYSEAVASARSILDFNQGGSITKDLESVIPYINVAFQGGRVAADAFRKDPVGTTSRVLQVATMASSVPIGISLALISAMKADDDDDKSSYDVYLDALSGISRYQKMKYINIVTGKKDDSGQYQVIKIAKAQELSPVMSITDDIYNNFIKKLAGKEKKSALRIIDDAAFTFNSNVMPVDVTSPAGLFTRNPIVKATLTYATGYDFFREEPLSADIGKVPRAVEGLNNPNIEDFYKKLGTEHGLSPVRSKAFVESLITGPNTNPFVGMLYGGADAAVSDKGMGEIGKDLAKSVYKSTGKRVISYTSDFNRQLEANKDLQDKIDQINIEKYKMKAEFNQLAKDYINKDISKADLDKKLQALDPDDRMRMTNKIKDKIQLKGIDGTILDIKYEKEPEAKALMIMHYYGDINDGSKESKEITSQMLRAKGVLTPKVIAEYNKLKEELSKQKTPN